MAIDTHTYRMIRRLYTVEGLSQRQIAKQLGVSRLTVRKYCEGSCIPGERKEYQIDKSPLRLALEIQLRYILQYCMSHRIKTRTRTIRDMLNEEKEYLLPLPSYPMDPSEEVKANVYPDLTVKIGGLKYSVPPEYVGMSVTVKISPFHVDIYHLGKLVWQHKKGMHPSDHQYIPEHYLEILQRKPRAIKNAVPINKGVMPAELSNFLQLCKEHDKNVQFVNILLLAKKLEPDILLWAVKQANLTGCPSYDRVCFYLEILERKADSRNVYDNGLRVQPANLKQYDQLIERGRKPDEKDNP